MRTPSSAEVDGQLLCGWTESSISTMPNSITNTLNSALESPSARQNTTNNTITSSTTTTNRLRGCYSIPTTTKKAMKGGGTSSSSRCNFKHYENISDYITEYRKTHVKKLVGYDGQTTNLELGVNIEDPYVFKTTLYRWEILQTYAVVFQVNTLVTGGVLWTHELFCV